MCGVKTLFTSAVMQIIWKQTQQGIKSSEDKSMQDNFPRESKQERYDGKK